MKKLFVALYNGRDKTTSVVEVKAEKEIDVYKKHPDEYLIYLKDQDVYIDTDQGLDEVYYGIGYQQVKMKTGHSITLPQLSYVTFISDSMERVNEALDKLPAEWTAYINLLKETAYLNIN